MRNNIIGNHLHNVNFDYDVFFISNQYFSEKIDLIKEMDGAQTVIPRHELMNIVSVTQLEKDTILVCYDSKLKFINSLCIFQGCKKKTPSPPPAGGGRGLN